MRKIAASLILVALTLCPISPALAFFWSSPKTALEAANESVAGTVSVLLKSSDRVELVFKAKGELDSLAYSDLARIVLAYGGFITKEGQTPPSIIVQHYAKIEDKYGNKTLYRTGSLRWSTVDLVRFNYENGDWYKMINLAQINDLLGFGLISLKAICNKMYADLYSGFCQKVSRR